MKKMKSLSLILLLGLLASCGTTTDSSSGSSSSSEEVSSDTSTGTSSEETNQSETTTVTDGEESVNLTAVLDELSQGVKIETDGVETVKGKKNNLYFEIASKPQEFSFVSYADKNRVVEKIHEYYTSLDEDGYIYGTRLDLSNSYQYMKVYNGMTGDYYKWTDGYDNWFALVSEDDFTETEKNVFELKDSLFEMLNSYLSTFFYGNPGMTFTSVLLSVDENSEIILSAEANFGSSYSYVFDSKVVESGEETKMNYRITPFEEVEDANFEDMITTLKKNNYKATVVNYSKNVEESSSVFITNEDKISYVTGEYDYGYYVSSEGMLQAVEKKEDGQYYKVGTPEEGSLDELRPAMNLSRACFDYSKDNSTYTLKSGVDGDMSSIVVLETIADEIKNFTITGTKEEGYTFTNINGDKKTVVQFTDIGTADVGYTKESVLEPVVEKTWADVLSTEDNSALATLIGQDNVSSIPAPSGYDTWFKNASSTADKIRFSSEYKETIWDDIFDYYAALDAFGFTLVDDSDTIIMQKEIEVSEMTKSLTLELSVDDNYFNVDFYFAA